MKVNPVAAVVAMVTTSVLVGSCGGGNPPSSNKAPPGVAPTAPNSTAAPSPSLDAVARPASGETTVACSPTPCGIHFVGQTLSFGPVYAFTATVAGSSYPAFRVDNVSISVDPGSAAAAFGDQALGLTDNQYNSTGQGQGPTSTDLATSHPECLSSSLPGYHFRYDVVSGTPLTLPKGVCFGFPDDKPPVVATTLKYFDGYPIPLTPVGQ